MLQPHDSEPPLKAEVSLKRLEANRRNAGKSTGPRTADGKLASRRNAVKHGILVSAAVIATEPDAQEFQSLLASLSAELAPVGQQEALLVQIIAHGYWTLRRVYTAEAALLRSIAENDVMPIASKGVRALDAIHTLRANLPTSYFYGTTLSETKGLEELEVAVYKEVEATAKSEVRAYLDDLRAIRPADPLFPTEHDAELLWRYSNRALKDISWAYGFLRTLQQQRSIEPDS